MNHLLKGVNLYLIGMMGAGKTTVGQLLASQLRYHFFDTDSLIEQGTQQTISDLFAAAGEQAFREIETQVLSELSTYTQLVVATGGGIVVSQRNWSYLHHGIVVWLDAPLDLLLTRLQQDTTRPLLAVADPVEKLRHLWEQRLPLYRQADLQVVIGPADTPEQVAEQVLTLLPSVLRHEDAKRNSHPA